ncbi:MAG: UDP-2,3-diacylglucosamine diphosphatase LpxI [Devosia sp.]|uniref:UDP-2,3-diacylglucosamine diphosphatase LpxI domain-containing protein n=1 Tax=Devosia sp. TaxID=1871048 RepID=UPI001AC516EC|nr:UDP-2,3-diacylglucosamine diphosphatase LpxI [Devosia sp.]MBN9314445.1 UDP-2,3-diacylglucosamine diphosphatase LpxI [Devosia sp.]
MPRRLSILAGTGSLVTHVIEAAQRAGDEIQVIALMPQPDRPGVTVLPGDTRDPMSIIRTIRAFRSTHITLAGGVTLGDRAREGLSEFATGSPASAGDAVLSKMSAVVRTMTGARILGAHEVARDLLAPNDRIAGADLTGQQLKSARIALAAARDIGRLDLGQAVVVAGARVVAAEDVGGTDELLHRVARHRQEGRIGDGVGPLILAKAAKPQQPLSVDLPAIGPDTVAKAAEAGISIIAVEAGKTLLLERAAMIEAAEKRGIAILGLKHG